MIKLTKKAKDYVTITTLFLWVFLNIFIFLSLTTNAFAQTQVDTAGEYLKLTENYDKILDYTDTQRCTLYRDKQSGICEVYENAILYLYATDTTAPENVIAKNVQQLSPTTYKVYSSDAFYQDEQTNTWKQTDFGIIEKTEFNIIQEQKLKSIEEISILNNPFKIYKVNAQSPIYANADDGAIYGSNATWATARGLSSGDGIFETSANWWSAYAEKYNGVYFIGRAFFRFDTSSLSGSVASSSLIITAQSNSDNNQSTSYYKLYNSNSADPLTTADFDQCTGTAISGNKDIGDFVVDTPEKILITDNDAIQVDGDTNICMLIGWDIEDTSIESANDRDGITQYYSEQTGTTYDPYLLVETGEAEPTCGDAECNGEETCETCEEDCDPCEEEATTTISELPELPFIDDLSIVTGRIEHYETSTTTPDWIEYTYYRITFFIWFIVSTILLYGTHQIGKVLITRWHKKK